MNGTILTGRHVSFHWLLDVRQYRRRVAEQRRKRLAAIANSTAARSLSSPAGSALALGGYGAGLLG